MKYQWLVEGIFKLELKAFENYGIVQFIWLREPYDLTIFVSYIDDKLIFQSSAYPSPT